jgi:hypothetical protein
MVFSALYLPDYLIPFPMAVASKPAIFAISIIFDYKVQ